ncbi:MAG: hypothetical protein WCQ53_00855 [bacterium]
MKKVYYNLMDGRVIVAFLFCYMVMFLIGVLNKLLLFSFGMGDTFFSVFRFFSTELGVSNPVLKSLMSYLMFLGSFYGALIWPLFYLVSMTFYAAIIQVILHIFLKEPKRFSSTLSVLYTVIAFLYALTLLPYLGQLAFGILLVFMVGKEIAVRNSFSKAKGVLLFISPGIIMSILSFGFLFSIFKMISFF